MLSTTDEKLKFMRLALDEAKISYNQGEIPVGAIIIKNGRVISTSHNENRASKNPLKHAEMISINNACAFVENERLIDCEMYVTKEPCAMCAGAIIHARIKKLIIATEDKKYGACGSVLDVCGNKKLNHQPEIEFGILKEESLYLLKKFFKELRKK